MAARNIDPGRHLAGLVGRFDRTRYRRADNGRTVPAFIASGEMAVAYFWMSWPPLQGPSASFWPHDQRLGGNGGELAVLFCFAFLLLATTGAGAWSVDGRRRPVGTTAAAPRRRFGLRR
jgi:hypothetical protein